MNFIEAAKEEKKVEKTVKKTKEAPKGKKGATKPTANIDILHNRGEDFYVPLDKIDESVFTDEAAPNFTYLPNRETMHMMIK